jgi:hypothetical protein
MRLQRIALICVLSIVASGVAWSQEYRGTYEQQMACTPDVWRLCSDRIPDVGRIVACLRANASQLSSNCRVAFEANEGGLPTDTARAVPQSPSPRACCCADCAAARAAAIHPGMMTRAIPKVGTGFGNVMLTENIKRDDIVIAL